jgi:hypothetical protein
MLHHVWRYSGEQAREGLSGIDNRREVVGMVRETVPVEHGCRLRARSTSQPEIWAMKR